MTGFWKEEKNSRGCVYLGKGNIGLWIIFDGLPYITFTLAYLDTLPLTSTHLTLFFFFFFIPFISVKSYRLISIQCLSLHGLFVERAC